MTTTIAAQPNSGATPIYTDQTYTDRNQETAAGLLVALAALPADDPSRPAARREVIEYLLPLARHLARRYRDRGESIDDLVQTATLGLIKAVDRFDPDRGVDFAAFAIPTILGELKRHFRDKAWTVRVPRRLQELRMAISDANATLNQTLGRSPTVAEVAAHLNVTEEDVLDGIEGARAYAARSLSSRETGEDHALSLGDLIGSDDPGYEATEARMALSEAMTTLPDRERRIVILRFYGNLTQVQIAEQVGISQMHVSRLLSRAFAHLRAHLSDTL
ncbi:SigB/SigF/SigG family RNA polymerase sigma factor [Micromonospora sp. CPCC 206061]|uniref:SigB/SigF/SigG family RNA polymerase sigma factor n=1 Tax=Micromonospora sp. CPCC 206061 TaxID=3122410 RepID=UPI002FF340BB